MKSLVRFLEADAVFTGTGAADQAQLTARQGMRSQSQSHQAARRNLLWAALFIAPNLFLVLVFVFIPTIAGFGISFTQWDGLQAPKFVGIQNYSQLLNDSNVWLALRNTALYAAVIVPVGLAGSLLLAVVLNKGLPGSAVFRTVFFIPVIMSGVLVSLNWQWLFQPDYGPVNYFLSQIGFRGPNWLNDPTWALVAIMIVSIWKGLGFNMVIFLAALQDVPRPLYEAARIDGATSWQEFRFITIPMISAPAFFALLIAAIDAFQVFDLVYLMTRGGPGRSTIVMMQYIYENAFQYFRMGYASALSVLFFLVILAFTIFQWRIRQRWVHGEA